MTYPKAYEGVKKLVTAEAFQIISAGLGVISAILAVAAFAGAADALVSGSQASAGGAIAGGIGVLLCSIGVLVLLVLSEIFMLIGLKQASEDEPKNFKIAFIGAIAVLIAAVLGGVLSAVPILGSALTTFSKLASISVFVYTVYGIKELATNLGDTGVNNLGNVVIICEIVQIILACIATFVGGVLAIIAGLVSLVGYIIFLVYLTKAKKMLEK